MKKKIKFTQDEQDKYVSACDGVFNDHTTPPSITNDDIINNMTFQTADKLLTTEEKPSIGYFYQNKVKKLVREIEVFSSSTEYGIKSIVNEWLADNIDFIEIDDFRFNRDNGDYLICYFYHYYVDENGEKIKIN